MDIKENVKKTDTWIRGLFIIVYGVVFYFLYLIIWLFVVFQFITKVITGDLNKNLSDTSGWLTDYATQILAYITFQSDEKPWPIGPMPGSTGGAEDTSEAAAEALEKKDDEA